MVILIIACTYCYSRYRSRYKSETIVPEVFIVLISIFGFRLDEIIIKSKGTEILTLITVEIVMKLLLAWPIIFFFTLLVIGFYIYKGARTYLQMEVPIIVFRKLLHIIVFKDPSDFIGLGNKEISKVK